MPTPSAASGETTLITGATGALGGTIIREALRGGGGDIVALVRDARGSDPAGRLDAALARHGLSQSERARVHIVRGDVRDPAWHEARQTRAMLRERVTAIFHLAASTDLSASRESLAAANVGGTQAMLALARDLHDNGRLARFNHFSTAFVAGSLRDDTVGETYPVAAPAWANAYEETKHTAEGLVHAAIAQGLPATVFRPSIVIGESETGWSPSFGLFYTIIKRIRRSGVRKVPGKPADRIEVVPGDFVARAALAIAAMPHTAGTIFHLTSDNAPDLGMLLEIGAQEVDWAREVRFVALDSVPQGALEMVRSVMPFLDYFHRQLRFDATNTRRALEGTGIALPDTGADFIRRIIRHGVEQGVFA